MKYLGLLVIFACIYTIRGDEPAPTAGPDLVVNIFRHGIRAPAKSDFDNTWGDANYGELTPSGIRQHYILGRTLALTYPELPVIKKAYDPTKVYIRTTQDHRTIMSAMAQFQGIFKGKGIELDEGYPATMAVPPYNDEAAVNAVLKKLENNKDAIPDHYLPPPVHTVDKKEDYLLLSYLNCFKSNALYKKHLDDDVVKAVYTKMGPSIEKAKKLGDNGKHIGDEANAKTFNAVKELGDTVIANKYNQKKDGGEKIDPTSDEGKDLIFWSQWYDVYPSMNEKIQREVFAAPILSTLLDHFKGKQNNTSPLELVLYGAKESMMNVVLAAFDIVTVECLQKTWENKETNDCNYPTYGSSLIFEYTKATSKIVFKYNGKTFNICKTEDSTCTLQQFEELVKKATGNRNFDGFFKWCENPKKEDKKKPEEKKEKGGDKAKKDKNSDKQKKNKTSDKLRKTETSHQ